MQMLGGLLIVIGMALAGYLDVPGLEIWVTPVAWYGYILFVDGLVQRRGGRPLLAAGRREEFLAMLGVSVLLWYVFEFHNLLFRNWEYIGLPASEVVTSFAMLISFATILPALWITHQFLQTFAVFNLRIKPRKLNNGALAAGMTAGLVMIAFVLVYPNPYTGPLVWAGYFFFFISLNGRLRVPGAVMELEKGSVSAFWTQGLAGLICGLVWESLNYGASAKWVYHVPYLEEIKIFEMPLAGFLGFFPFGIFFIEMYCFLKYFAAPRLR